MAVPKRKKNQHFKKFNLKGKFTKKQASNFNVLPHKNITLFF